MPRGLKRGSATARFLGLRFLNPLKTWTFSLVSILSRRVEVFATGRTLVQRILMIIVCLSVIEKPQQGGGPGPLGAVEPLKKKLNYSFVKVQIIILIFFSSDQIFQRLSQFKRLSFLFELLAKT